jgi:hypothetical protein
MATARQVEAEFKAQTGPNSTWRWFAKKVAENKYQIKFPTAKKVEELAFFSGMLMGTIPWVTFKVEPWDPYVGAKAKIESTWFGISGIPMEKRTEKRVCYVASLVWMPLEVDKNNLKRWEYVRVKIGCKDIAKVPAVVEGLLKMHFYDFIFRREVPTYTHSKPAWNTWTRTSERDEDDKPSPKKHKKGYGKTVQEEKEGGNNSEAGTSSQYQGRKNNMEVGSKALSEEKEKEDGSPNKEDQGKETDGSEQSSSPTYFDELISLGGEHFTFGTFKEMEIKDIYTDCNLMRQAQWHSTNMGQIYTSTSMTPFL